MRTNSKSAGLSKVKENDPPSKKNPKTSNSSPTSLEHKPICKTVRQKIYVLMLSFMTQNFISGATCECGRVLRSHKSVYFGINKYILYFPYCFYVPCTFHWVLSHFTFHVSLSSLLITLKSKRCEWNFSALFYKRLAIGQSNVQAILTKIEEPDTLSNILNIIFQTCCYVKV